MKSLRLEAVASLVKENCNVLDVGTDHAYLPIILSKTGKCQSIIASDVSNNALSYGEANLKKYHITNVKLVLSDGLKNIRDKYDTLTICGMGTYTIIDILKSGYLPENIIISSNNDLYTLRCYLNSINYKIMQEIISLSPDLILIALGVPNQELLINKYIEKAKKGVFIGVGGTFDVLSGCKKRAPKLFIKLNLEWLYRIICEPTRLKRFIQNNIVFMFKK